MKKINYLLLLSLFLSVGVQFTHAQGADKPYPVIDTKAAITQKPYLVDPSATAMTIMWMTDSPSQSKVLYTKKGSDEFTKVAEAPAHGLIPVSTRHVVRLTGLEPGTTYKYKVASRKVVKLRPYWPKMGKWTKSPVYSFTTFNPNASSVSFSVITDTHENVKRINTFMEMIDWDETDFLVHDGDAFNYLKSEQQLFEHWLAPIAKGLNQSTPLIYARGNHELRGPFARNLFGYVPIHTGNFYYACNIGPLHLMVLDTGEDKADSTNVYAGLNRMKEYREKEYQWFKHHVQNSQSLEESPFQIIVMHAPHWGWVDGEKEKWTNLANKAGVDLVISGHWHQSKRLKPGELGNNHYPVLVLDQQQIADVTVSEQFITVKVRNTANKLVASFKIDIKGNLYETKTINSKH